MELHYPRFHEGLDRILVSIKANWLKGIGVAFLSAASAKYFAHHAFGCSLVAIALLVYAFPKVDKWVDRMTALDAKGKEFEKGLERSLLIFFIFAFCVIAGLSAPPAVRNLF